MRNTSFCRWESIASGLENSMRIGIDIRELDKRKETGIGRFILNFLNFVNSQDTGNEYILFGNQYTRQLDFNSHIETKLIHEFSKIFYDQIILWQEASKERIDLFFSPFYKGPILTRAKLIVTCHDLHFLNSTKNFILNWLRQFYCRQIWKRADLIIAVSRYSKQQAIKFMRCDPQKFTVVYDSVSENFRPLDKEKAFCGLKNKFPQLKKDFILYVGNLKPHKNVAGLIKAYGLLSDYLQDRFQLVIVGEKDHNYEKLAYLVKQYDIKGNIKFLDQISDDELLFMYNVASTLALVSFREGFGLPALEAMACGTPVVVSNIPALQEVVGEAGLYVNPLEAKDIAAALQKAITDNELRKDLSQKGLSQSSKFKNKYSALAILEAFKKTHKLSQVKQYS